MRWLLLIFSILLLGLSVYLLFALFRDNWTSTAAKVCSKLSVSLGVFAVPSFLMSWITALPPLLAEVHYPLLAAIFMYSGMILFILVAIHSMRMMKRYASSSS